MRRWQRQWYDVSERLEHTEDRYEVSANGDVIAREHHRRSPATRGYTQAQAVTLYEEAGFVDVRLYRGLSFEPAGTADSLFSIVGKKP